MISGEHIIEQKSGFMPDEILGGESSYVHEETEQ